jgi:hypothetical protein
MTLRNVTLTRGELLFDGGENVLRLLSRPLEQPGALLQGPGPIELHRRSIQDPQHIGLLLERGRRAKRYRIRPSQSEV